MLNQIKASGVSKLLPRRDSLSHKGENGHVLIAGGSKDYYAPPVLAGIAALRAGADLVTLFVPECNFDCTRSLFPDFIVHAYPGEYLTERYCEQIIEYGKTKCSSVLLGPGLGKREKTINAVLEIVLKLKLPTVLDASAISALKKINKFPLSQTIVITPHGNEFKNLVDRDILVRADDPKSVILLRSLSMDLGINVLLKGHTDFVASEEGVVEMNKTGNAGMTVGGSGDVLAGVCACFLGQGVGGFDSAKVAAFYTGKAGDVLYKRFGNGFLASDLAQEMAKVLN